MGGANAVSTYFRQVYIRRRTSQGEEYPREESVQAIINKRHLPNIPIENGSLDQTLLDILRHALIPWFQKNRKESI